MHFQSFNYNRNIVSNRGNKSKFHCEVSFLSASLLPGPPRVRSTHVRQGTPMSGAHSVRCPSWRTLGKNWRDERYIKLFGEKMMKQTQMKHKWKNIWSWDFWDLDPAIFWSSGIRAATRFPWQLGWHKRATCARQVLKDFFVMQF